MHATSVSDITLRDAFISNVPENLVYMLPFDLPHTLKKAKDTAFQIDKSKIGPNQLKVAIYSEQ